MTENLVTEKNRSLTISVNRTFGDYTSRTQLRYLAERREVVVHRKQLLREVWGYASAPHTRSVDQAIVRLRKKIEPDPQHPTFIHTVHGDGYCLTTAPRQEGPRERRDRS